MPTHKGFMVMIALLVMMIVGVFFLHSSHRTGEIKTQEMLHASHFQAQILLENMVDMTTKMIKENNNTVIMSGKAVFHLEEEGRPMYELNATWDLLYCDETGCTHERKTEGNVTSFATIEAEVRSVDLPVRLYKKTLARW